MTLVDRLVGAPISWGVCEVPGWGLMLKSARVLPEMKGLGLHATELGAPGFFPETKEEISAALKEAEMTLVGGFVPLVLHDEAAWPQAIENAKAAAEIFAHCGADRFVTAVVQDYGWSRPTPLDRAGMRTVGNGLKLIDQVCADYGIVQTMHPHVDTLVETKADVDLALEETSSLWCLDTGHLAIGGTDPVAFTKENADRIGHAHLKDVNMSLAGKVMSREISLLQAVQQGIFVPFGHGDVDIAAVVLELEKSGYQGRYVLEQDTAIMDGEPAEGSGPIDDVRTCINYLLTEVAPQL